jgi:hypothetical protein
MPTYERQHASRHRNAVQGATRPAAEPAHPLLSLHDAAGNAAVASAIAVQRELAQEMHEHGAGCGHNPPVQRAELEAAKRRPGSDVDPTILAKAETAAGTSLPGVVVHRDQEAQSLASRFQARALTSEKHIFVGQEGADERTMLHELGHVRDQMRGQVPGTNNGGDISLSSEGDAGEVSADNFAAKAGSVSVPVQRAPLSEERSEEPAPAQGPAPAVQRAPNIITVDPDERRRRETGYVRTSYGTVDSSTGRPRRRDPDQNDVMGGSASDAMRAVGRHPGGDVSWLHGAAAWSQGDPVHGTPQRAGNLFAGTQNTNMAHLRRESWVTGRGANMVGAPITQISLAGPRGGNVYDRATYSVRSPYDPLNDRSHMALDPRDTRPVGQRPELPSRREIHRSMDRDAARWTMNALPRGTVPEYDDWDDRRRRRSDSRSASPNTRIVYIERSPRR